MGGCTSSVADGMTEEQRMLEKCKQANAKDFNAQENAQARKIASSGKSAEEEFNIYESGDASNKYNNPANREDVQDPAAVPEDEGPLPPDGHTP